jgi:hypothetical protein
MNTPAFKVYNILTEAAAKLYGKNTKWCTAAEKNNMFEHYKGQGNLYIIITQDGRKFQLHMEQPQFRCEKIIMLSVMILNTYQSFLNMQNFSTG